MDRKFLSSNKLRSVGYDSGTGILEIELLIGSVYQYSNVPAKIYSSLMLASSHGSYFLRNIHNVYECRRIR